MKQVVNWLFVFLIVAAFTSAAAGQSPEVTFHEPSETVEVYDFAEVAISVLHPTVANPFTDVTIAGQFCRETGEPVRVDGFCDSSDGSLFRIRFMPSEPGRYDYVISFRQGAKETLHKGRSFTTR